MLGGSRPHTTEGEERETWEFLEHFLPLLLGAPPKALPTIDLGAPPPINDLDALEEKLGLRPNAPLQPTPRLPAIPDPYGRERAERSRPVLLPEPQSTFQKPHHHRPRPCWPWPTPQPPPAFPGPHHGGPTQHFGPPPFLTPIPDENF